MTAANTSQKKTSRSEFVGNSLPTYTDQLALFHRAFAAELGAVVHSLPLAPHLRALDVACGDGFYTRLLAERLRSPGGVTALDINPAFLELAKETVATATMRCAVDFELGALADVSQRRAAYDLVWCAQSLYSLPEPVEALQQMAAATVPGGIVAVLENDSIHQIMLPWPSRIEIAIRAAEFAALTEESERPSKYYAGRRLPSVFGAAGLEPLYFRTQCIDRRAPLEPVLEAFLQSYLQSLAERVTPRLQSTLRSEFEALIDPASDRYLVRDPHFTLSWLNVLVWGRRRLRSE